jgi:hypothetical protein
MAQNIQVLSLHCKDSSTTLLYLAIHETWKASHLMLALLCREHYYMDIYGGINSIRGLILFVLLV